MEKYLMIKQVSEIIGFKTSTICKFIYTKNFS